MSFYAVACDLISADLVLSPSRIKSILFPDQIRADAIGFRGDSIRAGAFPSDLMSFYADSRVFWAFRADLIVIRCVRDSFVCD